MTGFSI